MKRFFYLIGLIASFALGAGLSSHLTGGMSTPPSVGRARPAYVVASWDILHPDQLQPFAEAVVPLAQKAGFESLVDARPQVLEGSWPYKGIVIVQKYPSMRALLDFWRAPEHEAAKKLRERHVESHFVIALEADK
jgi:uncharacterized protein (DUF1330 family)